MGSEFMDRGPIDRAPDTDTCSKFGVWEKFYVFGFRMHGSWTVVHGAAFAVHDLMVDDL